MPEEFTFTTRNTGSYDYLVLDRQDRSTSYGVAWYAECCKWVAEYPGIRPGNGGGIPGFASREWAAPSCTARPSPSRPAVPDRPSETPHTAARHRRDRALATFGHITRASAATSWAAPSRPPAFLDGQRPPGQARVPDLHRHRHARPRVEHQPGHQQPDHPVPARESLAGPCTEPMHRTPVMSARAVVDHIREFPA
jgi:hypothetical protein